MTLLFLDALTELGHNVVPVNVDCPEYGSVLLCNQGVDAIPGLLGALIFPSILAVPFSCCSVRIVSFLTKSRVAKSPPIHLLSIFPDIQRLPLRTPYSPILESSYSCYAKDMGNTVRTFDGTSLGSGNNIGDHNSITEAVGGNATSSAHVSIYTSDEASGRMAVWAARTDLKFQAFIYIFIIMLLLLVDMFVIYKWLAARRRLRHLKRRKRSRQAQEQFMRFVADSRNCRTEEFCKVPMLQFTRRYNDSGLAPARPGFFDSDC